MLGGRCCNVQEQARGGHTDHVVVDGSGRLYADLLKDVIDFNKRESIHGFKYRNLARLTLRRINKGQ